MERLESPIDALELVKAASGSLEMSHVTTFKGYRKNKLGEEWLVTVEVRDYGPSAHQRYFIIATDEVGRMATGNGDKHFNSALSSVHWSDLDDSSPKPRGAGEP